MMPVKIQCARKEPNKKLFSSRDFALYSDAAGDVFVNTTLIPNEWSSSNDQYQMIAFVRKRTAIAKTHTIVFESFDLKVVELTSTVGRDYLVAVKPGGGKR